jgi:taurine dioxygenase
MKSERTATRNTGPLQITPVTVEIGAEVQGIDLRKPLDQATVGTLLAALQRHLVLFFHDQHLTPMQHIELARRFGRISIAPFGPKHPDHPEITVLDQTTPKHEGADSWHADNTFMPQPPMGSIRTNHCPRRSRRSLQTRSPSTTSRSCCEKLRPTVRHRSP